MNVSTEHAPQPSSDTSTPDPHRLFGDLGRNWGWMLALGVLFIVMGVVALGMPVAMTLATVFVFGAFLLAGGILQLFEAFRCKGWKGILWHVLIALLYVAAGVIILQDPALSSFTLTAMLGWMVVAIGVFRIVIGLQMRGQQGWGWLVFAGVVSILLGAVILAKWPVSGLLVIGVLVGVEMLLHGWSYVFLALAARRVRRAMEEGQG